MFQAKNQSPYGVVCCSYSYINKLSYFVLRRETFVAIMERGDNEYRCLSLSSGDLQPLQSVSEVYFTARENDEETVDSDSESSSSDSCHDLEHTQDLDFDFLEIHASEKTRVEKFYEETCQCKLAADEKPCSTTFKIDDFVDRRNNCSELSSTELDLVILGAIQCSLNCYKTSTSGRTEKNRQYTRMGYFYHGQRICMRTFLFLHCLHRNRFYSLVKHYRKNGLSLRVQGKKNRLQSSTSSAETVEPVVEFILNTAEEQALLLPGVPGFKRIDVKLLPSNLTKHGLWKTYTDICVSTGKPSVRYSKFCDLWNQLCPFIVIMWPATDLCWTCQKNNNHIRNSMNLPESDKAEAVRAQEQHLLLATGERNVHKNCCRESKDGIQEYLKVVDFTVEHEPCLYDGTVHYSYDYAQQLHFPADPNQPGPIYFKTPRKCALFGVCCEAVPRQANFLIDESALTGKGANSTISYVHYFFHCHGLGETKAQLHADNCGAQNKNSAFLWYYLWRVMSRLHDSINYDYPDIPNLRLTGALG